MTSPHSLPQPSQDTVMNDTPTNLQIAELLKKQTYDERMEMAGWFRDVAADAKTDDKELDSDLFAFWLGAWAEGEVESYADAEPQP